MNLSDFKFYSLLFVALLIIGYIYLGQADSRENVYSEIADDDIEREIIVNGEQKTNSVDRDIEYHYEGLSENVSLGNIE